MIEAIMMWENQHLKHCKQLFLLPAVCESSLGRSFTKTNFFFLNVIYLPNISVLRHVCKPPKSVCLCI